MSQPLTPAQQIQALQNSYQLFGRLFLEPVTAALLPYLQRIPELADVLPEPFEADEAAARHHRLFSFNVYPHAAVFLDSSRLLGGQVTNEMAGFYQAAAFEADPALEADHLGQAFGFLGFLAEREAAALAGGAGDSVIRRQQFDFLDQQLLPWLFPCLVAIEQQEYEFYGRLSELALTLTATHYARLAGIREPEGPVSIPLSTVGQGPVLEDDRTGLRDIARYLITPIQSGFYLGRGDINRLGRAVSLPHGFGSREQMLRTLFEAAGQYELAPRLFDTLDTLVGNWQRRYREIGDEFGETADFVRPWEQRLAGTAVLLAQMKDQL